MRQCGVPRRGDMRPNLVEAPVFHRAVIAQSVKRHAAGLKTPCDNPEDRRIKLNRAVAKDHGLERI